MTLVICHEEGGASWMAISSQWENKSKCIIGKQNVHSSGFTSLGSNAVILEKSSDCHHEKPATYVTLTIDGLIKVSGMLYKHQLT